MVRIRAPRPMLASSQANERRVPVRRAELGELGPIDSVVMEWPGASPDASEVQPLLLDLVDQGIIRILDMAFGPRTRTGRCRLRPEQAHLMDPLDCLAA
jgi:hypothetical protein